MTEGNKRPQIFELLLLGDRRVRKRIAELSKELDRQPLQDCGVASFAERKEFALEKPPILLQARLFEVPRFRVSKELFDGLGDRWDYDSFLPHLSGGLPAADEVGCRFPRTEVKRTTKVL